MSSIIDVQQLNLLSAIQNDSSSDDGGSAEEPDQEPAPGHSKVQAAVQISLLGSDADPEMLPTCKRSYHATNLEEFMSLLALHQDHWGIDVLEICGGKARVTYLSVQRHLTTGQCLDINVAVDLNLAAHQKAV